MESNQEKFNSFTGLNRIVSFFFANSLHAPKNLEITYGEVEKAINELISNNFEDEFIEKTLNSFWIYDIKNKQKSLEDKIKLVDNKWSRIPVYFTDFEGRTSSVLLSVCNTNLSDQWQTKRFCYDCCLR